MSKESDTLLARIDERTETILKTMDEHGKWMVAHERRIISLEKWRGWITGAGTAVASLLGYGTFHK